MVGLAGVGLLLGARAFFKYVPWCCMDPVYAYHYRYEEFASHAVPYEAARLAIVAVAALSTGVVLARARRAASAPRLFAPVLLFVAGLAAFALTRAERHDTQSPMPLLPASGLLWMRSAQAAALPPALGCDPDVPEAPGLALEGGEWFIDGLVARDEAEVTRLLAQKRELWQQLQPYKPFPGVFEAAIPAATPLEAVRPMLAAARAAGYPTLQVLESLPAAPWPSCTLGAVAYRPRACRIRIAPGRELPDARTWGEMARALAR
jgi:hypothetical protein